MIKSYNSALLLLVGLLLGVGATVSIAGAAPDTVSPYKNLTIFARALAHIEASYVEQIDQDQLIYGAIRGMLKVLDPHSAFMTAEEFRILSADEVGRYAGIGVEVDVKDGWLSVIGVYQGGPGARSGIRAGDRFISIDGRSARDLPIDEAIAAMRGEPGTKVQVALRRPGRDSTLQLTLIRAVIHVDSVQAHLLPKCTAFLQIRAFNEDTASQFRELLDETVERGASCGGVQAVLVDLRNNPGGLLDSAVLIADEFLDRGVIVSTYGRGGVKLREFKAIASGTRPAWPIVAIVNQYTASAAEIVAGALHDHGRAVVVGTRTFGKGTVQNVISLPDGSAMKLTTAKYFTPSGRSIQAEGIEPDVVVEQSSAGAARAKAGEGTPLSEASLDGHLKSDELFTPPRSTPSVFSSRTEIKTPNASTPNMFDDDNQGRVAFQILQTLVAKKR
jgi:carboxyl-terminal processing protease